MASAVHTLSVTIAAEVCSQLDARLDIAEEALAADTAASRVTAGVVAEFRRKLTKSRSLVEQPDAPGHREAVVELEQAADSAKAAALADTGALRATRDAIVSAHDSICWFKATGALLDRAMIEPEPTF